MKYRISDICTINESSLSKRDSIQDILYLDTANLSENTIGELQKFKVSEAPSRAQRKVRNNTIVYSSVRPRLCHYGIMENPASNLIVSTGFITLDVINTDIIDPYFLYYKLTERRLTEYIGTIADTNVSSYPSINPTDLGNIIIEFPDILEQRRISMLFRNFEKKIALNKQINCDLEAMAKQLYDYWFVKFDFPNEEGKPYKSSGGKMVWNEKINKKIPEGWIVGNLFDVANFTNGLACQKFRPIDMNHSLPVIKIKEMHEGFSEDTEYVKDDIPESVKVFNGDILFSWSASLEVMLWAYGNGGLNQHIFKVTSKNGWPKYFYYYQLQNYIATFKRMAEARKTTMGHITQDHLAQSLIVLPSDNIIAKALEVKITPILDLIVSHQIEIEKLKNQRDSLLPLLMNGQVTINQ